MELYSSRSNFLVQNLCYCNFNKLLFIVSSPHQHYSSLKDVSATLRTPLTYESWPL